MAALTTTMDLGAFVAEHLPATFTAPGLTEKEFIALCEEFPDNQLEYTAEGTVIVMPYTDPRSSAGVTKITQQLSNWSDRRGGGMVSGPDGIFFLKNGARRAPDAVWFDLGRFQAAEAPGVRVPMFTPDFLIEVRSPAQRARPLREKMAEYIDNGVKLGWLIDPIERTVTIYRPGRDPEVLINPATVSGEAPVEGFVLDLFGIV